jgi:hypothetical protein
MGGSALGKAVEASKLLEAIDVIIRHMISGLSFYVVVMVLSVVVLVRTSLDLRRSLTSSTPGNLYLYQPYHCQCAAGPDCSRSRSESPYPTSQPTHFPHGSHLFHWHGHACLWVP